MIFISIRWVLTPIHFRYWLIFAQSLLCLGRSEILTITLLTESVQIGSVWVSCSILLLSSRETAVLRLHVKYVLDTFVWQLLLWMHVVAEQRLLARNIGWTYFILSIWLVTANSVRLGQTVLKLVKVTPILLYHLQSLVSVSWFCCLLLVLVGESVLQVILVLLCNQLLWKLPALCLLILIGVDLGIEFDLVRRGAYVVVAVVKSVARLLLVRFDIDCIGILLAVRRKSVCWVQLTLHRFHNLQSTLKFEI